MHKVVIGAGMICLICVAAITGMLIAGQRFPVDQLSVFDAVEGENYTVLLADSRTGHVLSITDHVASERFPALSPDGQQVAFVSWRDGNSEIYVMDIRTRAMRNISQHLSQDLMPSWSPDGALIAYVSRMEYGYDIFITDLASDVSYNLTRSPTYESNPEWLTDSTQLTYTSDRQGIPAQFVLDLNQCAGIRAQGLSCWRVVENTGNLEVVDQILSG